MKHSYKFLLVILIASLLLAGCGSAEQTPTIPADEIKEDFAPVVGATGVVIPAQWAALSVRSQGAVEELLVEEGQHVSKGDTLLRLGNNEAAQAAVARARQDLIAAERAFSSSQADALKDLDGAYEAVRKAQYDFDNFDIPYEFSGMTPTQALEAMLEMLDKARADFEPYKYRDEKSLALTGSERNNGVYRDQGKMYKKQLDDAWADFNKAIRWAKLEADLQRARSQLDAALKEFNAVSGSQEDSLARAGYLSAQSNLRAAETALSDTELTAPFDGVVCNLDVRVGEWVSPGMPVLLLGDLQDLRIETTDLNEIDAARVHPQDAVSITFDALPDVAVDGTVLRVANKSTEGSGVKYTAVIVLGSLPADLRWGMTAFVDIEVSG